MKKLITNHILGLLVFLLSTATLNASNIIWTGSFNNEWNQVENWNPMIVPTGSDEVTIPSTWQDEITIIGANASCKSLEYNGIGFQLHINEGWDLILSGDLNIHGKTKIHGYGGIEVIGNNNCHFNHGDSVIMEVNHINIKSSAQVVLNNDLMMPLGSLNIYSGHFTTNSKHCELANMVLVDGTSNRSLNIANSVITTNILYLYVLNNGAFYSAGSTVNNQLVIQTNGIVNFHQVNSANKAAILTIASNAHISIDELNALGDLSILGSTSDTLQSFSITDFNIVQTPSIVKLTAEPFVSGYHFYLMHGPAGCEGDVLITDGKEVTDNRILMNIVGAAHFAKAAIANVEVVQGSFNVDEGLDLGNNSGIIINQTLPATYYWINGQGNWNDPNHWSLTSGGVTAGCIPGLKDHAIFNNASGFNTGDSVLVTHHILCNHLIFDPTIIHKPILSQLGGTEYSIHIAGDIDLRGLHYFNVAYPLYLWNRTNANIQTASQEILDDITFMNQGIYHLIDDLNCNSGKKNMYQLLGALHTHGFSIHAGGFVSKGLKSSGTPRSLFLYNSLLHMGHSTDGPGGVYIYSNGLNLSAGTSTFQFEYEHEVGCEFKIEGNTDLHFYNLRFLNKVGLSSLIFNKTSSFNKVQFYGNGEMWNGSNMVNAQMSAIDTLSITGNFRYEIEQQRILHIRKKLIQVHGVCSEISFITSTSLANNAYIYSSNPAGINFENTWIENLEASGVNAPFEVTNGVDGGNNSGFSFLTYNNPRIFYWNGEASNAFWSQGSNWNIGTQAHAGNGNDLLLYNTNGCIPGFNDSVVFQAESFPIKDTVTINMNANFKGMLWTDIDTYPRFLAGLSQFSLNNYGGLEFDTGLEILFPGEITFRSPNERELRFQQVPYPGNMVFNNLGKYNLMDSLTCTGFKITFLAGSFSTSGHAIQATNLYIQHSSAPASNNNQIDFSNSNIRIGSVFWGSLFENVSVFQGDESNIELLSSGSSFSLSGSLNNLEFGNVNFLSPTGHVDFSSNYYSGTNPPHFKHINFEPSGFIIGNNSIDTLVLAEGEEYSLGANQTQYINNLLYSKGSPCYRTTIVSNVPGTRAYIQNSHCHLLVEHARLRDIEGILGSCNANNYLVGVGGEDMGNNMHWNFIPGNPIQGLGPDTVLTCNTLPYPQTALGFGRYDSIVWFNGSTGDQLLIDTACTISTTVIYSPVCIVNDSRIFDFDNQISQVASLQNIRCNGMKDGSIQLNFADVDTSSDYNQFWVYPDHSIRNEMLNIGDLGPGNYTSIVSIPGYEALCTDTAMFTIIEPEKLMVTLDTVITGKCFEPDGTIRITTTGGSGQVSFLWSDQSTSEDNYAAISGWNEVVVSDTNQCTAQLMVDVTCVEHLNIPQLLTPNGDNLGDNWEIIDLYRLYPDNDVKIMNRWGNVVYHKNGYHDEFTGLPNTGDTFSIGYLSSGTYFYIIDLGKNYKTLTGYLEIVY
jgi:gliding motility-associated-like protein